MAKVTSKITGVKVLLEMDLEEARETHMALSAASVGYTVFDALDEELKRLEGITS
jgi:hypothetical protein